MKKNSIWTVCLSAWKTSHMLSQRWVTVGFVSPAEEAC